MPRWDETRRPAHQVDSRAWLAALQREGWEVAGTEWDRSKKDRRPTLVYVLRRDRNRCADAWGGAPFCS